MTQSSFPAALLLPVPAAGPGDILAAGLRLCRLSLLATLPWSMLAVLLGQLPSAYLLQSGQSLALLAPKDGLWWALMLLAAIGTLWCWLVIMLRQRAMLVGQGSRAAAGLGADLQAALRRLPVALTALVLAGIAVAIGAALLILPGIYLLVAFWPALALVVFEGRDARAALDESLQLVRGAWRHLAAVLVVVLMTLLGLFVIGSLVGLLLMQFSATAAAGDERLQSTLVAALLGALFQPLLISLSSAAYADLCRRRDQASSAASSSA